MQRLAYRAEDLISKVGTWEAVSSHVWLQYRIDEIETLTDVLLNNMWDEEYLKVYGESDEDWKI